MVTEVLVLIGVIVVPQEKQIACLWCFDTLLEPYAILPVRVAWDRPGTAFDLLNVLADESAVLHDCRHRVGAPVAYEAQLELLDADTIPRLPDVGFRLL